jgi:hypothetical protein
VIRYDKFSDPDDGLHGLVEEPPIFTVAQLLQTLGVDKSEERVRVAAVLSWLEENEPNELLLASMERTPI